MNLRHRWQYGVLNPLHGFPAQIKSSQGPFSGGLPKKLDVGEEFSAYFPYDADTSIFSRERVGFVDTYGRNHWCSRKHMRKARERFIKDFGKVPME